MYTFNVIQKNGRNFDKTQIHGRYFLNVRTTNEKDHSTLSSLQKFGSLFLKTLLHIYCSILLKKHNINKIIRVTNKAGKRSLRFDVFIV